MSTSQEPKGAWAIARSGRVAGSLFAALEMLLTSARKRGNFVWFQIWQNHKWNPGCIKHQSLNPWNCGTLEPTLSALDVHTRGYLAGGGGLKRGPAATSSICTCGPSTQPPRWTTAWRRTSLALPPSTSLWRWPMCWRCTAWQTGLQHLSSSTSTTPRGTLRTNCQVP